MKRRYIAVLGLLVGGAILLFWAGQRPLPQPSAYYSPPPDHRPPPGYTGRGRARPSKADVQDAPVKRRPSYVDEPAVTNLSPAASNLVQLATRFAAAAHLPDFEPTVIAFRDHTNGRGDVVGSVISTRTHAVSAYHVLDSVTSYFDADPPLDPYERAHAQERWYECTGTWTEQEAVKETLRILRELGETKVANALATTGQPNYEMVPFEVPDPSVAMVRVTPFATVTLKDNNGSAIVTAQYRLASTGPILTRWHYWPGPN